MPTPCTAPANGVKNVTTANTPVQITATSTVVHSLWIQARTTNTGLVAMGWSNAVRASGTVNAPVLAAGQSVTIKQGRRSNQEFDISDLWFDAAVNGEGVTYFYF